MSRKNLPGYLLHKPTGQARVVIDGQTIYLGKFNSPESRQKYQAIITEYLNNQEELPIHLRKGANILIRELCKRFLDYAKEYYQKNGRTTGTHGKYTYSVEPLIELFGDEPISKFGPLALQKVRNEMIDSGLARVTVNNRIDCIRNVFRWAASNELCEESVHSALMKVKRLEKGRSKAPDHPPVTAVPDEYVEKILPLLPPIVADMIQIQRLTGCRPDEICMMRSCDLERNEKIWKFVPFEHKTEHKGKSRWIAVGFRAQAILQKYLDQNQDAPTAFLFSPAETVRMLRQKQRQNRKTKVQPSQIGRRTQDPLRKPGIRYTVQAYRTAIQRACRVAGIPIWAPNQLRHSLATHVRSEFGLDVAQAILGHSSAAVTQIYAELDFEKAVSAIEKIG